MAGIVCVRLWRETTWLMVRRNVRVKAGVVWRAGVGIAALLLLIVSVGCRNWVESADRDVVAAIRARQESALNYVDYEDPPNESDVYPPESAYDYVPNAIRANEVPEAFRVRAGEDVPLDEVLSGEADATQVDPAPAEPEAAGPTTSPSTAPDPAKTGEAPEGVSEEIEAAGAVPSEAGIAPPVDRVVDTVEAMEEVSEISAEVDVESRRRALLEGQYDKLRDDVLTLTEVLAYAQRHQRELQTAKEDLYLSALALTLERHLWTPIFASNLRTVYGNYGEITDFDQAMRFVADLSVSQRLPYGGEFTATAISTLIRDVKKSITATENSQISLELRVPFLRGAGHVAQEELIQLERALTYAVRSYERFRRRQLVDVARAYFDLLRTKQRVRDSETSLRRNLENLERARALEKAGQQSPLDTLRAEEQVLTGENRLLNDRENFRIETDQLKLLIGMPVDEPIGLDDLVDIEAIERAVLNGTYPLLRRPPAVVQEDLALNVATTRRLDLLSVRDQIDDARRGVDIAKNDLLPDLDWTSSVTWDTDPEHFRLGGFEAARATWRSEILLSLPLERTRERNAYRASLIDVRRAERRYRDSLESIRAEVRRAINAIILAERSIQIQRQAFAAAERRREYAEFQFREGDISNRDLVEAEDAWTNARNALNQAKTTRWTAILNFRLTTGTLLVDEYGRQRADRVFDPNAPQPPRVFDENGDPLRDAESGEAAPRPAEGGRR